MAKSQLFTNPAIKFIFCHGGAFPVRRGHQDEEAFKTAYAILDRGGCLLMYPEGGRSRSGGLGRAAPGRRPDRARVGRAGGPGGDPRLARGARVAQAAVPEGDRAVRRAAAASTPSRRRPASSSSRSPGQVFERVREMYSALEEKGRRGVIKALREGIGAPAERQVPAGQPR